MGLREEAVGVMQLQCEDLEHTVTEIWDKFPQTFIDNLYKSIGTKAWDVSKNTKNVTNNRLYLNFWVAIKHYSFEYSRKTVLV